MELLNYLFPFNDFVLPLTLSKVNKHYFGKDEIKLESGNDLYTFLVSPSDSVFMRVESDEYKRFNIYWGDVVIIERNHLKYDGPAAIKSRNKILIRELKFNKEFEPIVEDLKQVEKFEYFGTIAYVLKSEEEDFLDMIGQELFIIE
jgi:hypothetical protein